MPFPFVPGRTEPRVVDLSDPRDDVLIHTSRTELDEICRVGDIEALSKVEGSFATVARNGVTIRLARTLGRPLRYFVAKRETGPYLVVADRIDTIADYCRREGIEWQFHPSYTRLVPAHHLTELDQVGCPDPNPRYRRFFAPEPGSGPADTNALAIGYFEALRSSIAAVVDLLPPEAPIGVAFSGGADSTAVAALVGEVLSGRNEKDRLRLYTLSVEEGGDRQAARTAAEALGFGNRWSAVEASADLLDLERAVACIEDYRPLDVQCAAVERAFLGKLRKMDPRLVFLFDGDGGDENWKSYPLEDSELTIRSVLNNPLLYHEGWGVDSIKHSLTYSGGLSRGIVRGFAPAREFGFQLLSPHASRPAIAAALAAPLRDLVGEDSERLLALKGEVVRAGLRAIGKDAPIAPKRRFQHGATSPSAFRSRLAATRPELRRMHEARFAGFAEPGGREERSDTAQDAAREDVSPVA
ncbi:MAG: asparagine synthase-related protein [Thermoanaerobaculia bacterium]